MLADLSRQERALLISVAARRLLLLVLCLVGDYDAPNADPAQVTAGPEVD